MTTPEVVIRYRRILKPESPSQAHVVVLNIRQYVEMSEATYIHNALLPPHFILLQTNGERVVRIAQDHHDKDTYFVWTRKRGTLVEHMVPRNYLTAVKLVWTSFNEDPKRELMPLISGLAEKGGTTPD